MTPKEAIEILDAIARRNVFCTLEAEPISAFELAHIALEKQIPKKPYISKEEYTTSYKCPVCGCRFISKIDGEYVAGNKYIHCYICGQAIDWNVMEENGDCGKENYAD